MAAYLVVDTELSNPEGYEQYKVRAKPLVEQFGGQYLARGGELTVFESDLWQPTRMVLIRFDSSAQAKAFYNSPEYQAVLAVGRANARRSLVLIEGL